MTLVRSCPRHQVGVGVIVDIDGKRQCNGGEGVMWARWCTRRQVGVGGGMGGKGQGGKGRRGGDNVTWMLWYTSPQVIVGGDERLSMCLGR